MHFDSKKLTVGLTCYSTCIMSSSELDSEHPQMFGLPGATITLMCDDGKIRTWTQDAPPPPREPRFRIEEMSVAELIQHKHHTFHRRDRRDDSVIGGGNINVKIATESFFCDEEVTYLQRFTKHVISWFKSFKSPQPPSPLQLEIWLDGCQSARIHREDTVMVVTVSAHPKYSCGLTLSGLDFTLPSDITQIRVKEMIHDTYETKPLTAVKTLTAEQLVTGIFPE